MCKFCEGLRDEINHVSILEAGKGSFNDGEFRYNWNIHLTSFDPEGVCIGFGIQPEHDKKHEHEKHVITPIHYCPFCGEHF